MKLFADNDHAAKSRFWYFLHRFPGTKLKKTTGEILDVTEIFEKRTGYVKNIAIWLRYNSRSGTHNMYKEYRATSVCDAVDAMYAEMAGRHRARNRSIQIIKYAVLPFSQKDETGARNVVLRRPHTIQMCDGNIKFPLAHRIQRPAVKSQKATYRASRSTTFRG